VSSHNVSPILIGQIPSKGLVKAKRWATLKTRAIQGENVTMCDVRTKLKQMKESTH